MDLDKESVDLIIRPISGYRGQINLQIKATSDDVVHGDQVKFSLPIKNYNDLRETTDIIPHYLVVLHLPGLATDWLSITKDELLIRGCAYYGNLFGLPVVSNTTARVVTLPCSQHLNVTMLASMILKAPLRLGTAS